METRVRVAHVDELPPGRGKLISVSGQHIAVVNLEGRLRATAEHAVAHVGGWDHLPGHAAPCSVGGSFFDAAAPDSPAEGFEGPALRVSVEGEDVVLFVDPRLAD